MMNIQNELGEYRQAKGNLEQAVERAKDRLRAYWLSISKEELKSHACGRQMFDYALAYSVQVARHLIVVNHPVIALDMLGHGVAQIRFLLVRKNVLLARNNQRRGRLARSLSLRLSHGRAKEYGYSQDNESLHS